MYSCRKDFFRKRRDRNIPPVSKKSGLILIFSVVGFDEEYSL